MNFRKRHRRDEPEINFIPLIDVLLVILIFLMVSTTYTKFTELQVNLPTANVDKLVERPKELTVVVSADGRYAIDGEIITLYTANAFSETLRRMARSMNDPILIVQADAGASHQAVMNVLESAKQAGLGKVTFSAKSGSK
jgi:biopolymer transport protein ExbD